jgi:hypothetical protein
MFCKSSLYKFTTRTAIGHIDCFSDGVPNEKKTRKEVRIRQKASLLFQNVVNLLP